MYIGHQYPQFFTATCLERQSFLKKDNYKERFIEDLRYLAAQGWIKVYAFVLMPNHLHYLWHVHPNLDYTKVREAHLWNMGQKIKEELFFDKEEALLRKFHNKEGGRSYPLWETNCSSIDLYTPKSMYQKLEYIHSNPTQEKWSLCREAKEYAYSSAEFYETGFDRFGFMTHIGERGIWNKEPTNVRLDYF